MADGRFKFPRKKRPFILEAISPNGKQAGIVRVAVDQREATIRVGPLAQATGRLVDAASKPISLGYIQYGIRVPENDPRASSTYFPFGVAILNGEGRFTLTGLVPGETYTLIYVPTGDDGFRMPSTVLATIQPTAAGMMEIEENVYSPAKAPMNLVVPIGDELRRTLEHQRVVSDATAKVLDRINCDFIVRRAVGSNPLDNNLPMAFSLMLSNIPGVNPDSVTYLLVNCVDFTMEGLTDVPLIGWMPTKQMFDPLKIQPGGKQLGLCQKQNAIMGTELAKKLNKKVGDDIDLFDNKFQVIGIYESPNSKEGNGMIISLMDLQSFTNQFREVGGFAIAANRPMDEKGFEELRQLIEAVQPGLEVTRVPRSNTDVEAKSKADAEDGD